MEKLPKTACICLTFWNVQSASQELFPFVPPSVTESFELALMLTSVVMPVIRLRPVFVNSEAQKLFENSNFFLREVLFLIMCQVIVPCGASESIICGKASKWETNGTAFCYALGFTVQSAVEEPCYASKSSLEEPLINTESSAWFQPLQIYWLVIVIVLRTICWIEIRGRYQRQMRGLIQRERLVGNMNGIAA